MQYKNKDHFHGSDLEKIEELYGIPKENILSFSDNVNPLGISRELKESLSAHLDVITSYPDRDYTKLREAIGEYVGCSSGHIVVGNGSTELISLAIRMLQPQKALLPEPTYSEYEREIGLAGGRIERCEIRETDGFRLEPDRLQEQLSPGYDLLMLCNPNNPTSQGISREDMRAILDACREDDVFVMVDETYVEFSEEDISAVPLTEEYGNLLVLRGTSKFFSAPGLRLGYAVTGNEEILTGMRALQNPWTISSLAEMAGRLMFRDRDYIRKTKELITGERARVCTVLRSWDSVKIYEPQANFVLVRILKKGITASGLFDHCIRQGLMIRNCVTFDYLDETYFRFCFRMPDEDDRLLKALKEAGL